MRIPVRGPNGRWVPSSRETMTLFRSYRPGGLNRASRSTQGRNRRALVLVLRILVLLGCLLLGCGRTARHRADANLVLITVDALRSDHLGCNGYPGNISPRIDSLATRGTSFGQAFANSSWTIASLPSIACSVLPEDHGCEFWNIPLKESVATLPEILSRAGIQTGFIGAVVPRLQGFDRGWHHFQRLPPTASDREVTRLAMEWLDTVRRKRFFLWIHLLSPHSPYEPSPDASENPPSIDPKAAAYDAEITRADAEIGIMLDFLNRAGLRERTAIIVSADHGEIMRERPDRMFDHSKYLYDELLRIPLILACPWLKQPRKMVEQQVQSLDIAPTVLDLMSLPSEPSFQGRSLLPLGSDESVPGTPSILASVIEDDTADHVKRLSIRTPEVKVILTVQSDTWEIYDLLADPGETANRPLAAIPAAAPLISRLKSYLAAHMTSPIIDVAPISEEETKKLKSLGYLTK